MKVSEKFAQLILDILVHVERVEMQFSTHFNATRGYCEKIWKDLFAANQRRARF